jgi:two-component system, OmpR family, sensor histidine kinase KdpD
MLYMLGITFVATRSGRRMALMASLLSVAALDFFFVPPRFTFAVQDARHLGTFGVMLGVGWLVATLTERIRTQTLLAQERERHANALNRLAAVLAEGGEPEAIRARAEACLARELEMQVQVWSVDAEGQLPQGLDEADRAVAQWALEHHVISGQGTEILPGTEALFIPLGGMEKAVGVLALRGPHLDPARQDLLPAFAAQIALALERARMAEERTQARLRVEEEQLKNALLSSVSHDLRTPLSTITGASSTLLEPGPGLDEEDRRTLLSSIHQEGVRLQRLVNNLLDLTRLEAGQVAVSKEWVPLEEVIGSVLNYLEAALAERSLQLEIADAWVQVDPVLFEQVLVNLVENALKYSLPTSPIRIQGGVQASELHLVVSDSGPGIPLGEEERIFHKLYRGKHRGVSGAGLGLAICRGIVQAHGGRISAENAPGGGACFRITLPMEGQPPIGEMS